MASEERKQQNSALNEANVHAALGAGEPEAETDAFQCGRCKNVSVRPAIIIYTILSKLGIVQDSVQTSPDSFRRRTHDGMYI
jgi:hypothetical protein